MPETEAVHGRTDAFAVQLALRARTHRIGAGSEFHLEAKRQTSLLVRGGSGHVGKFATGKALARSQRINIEVGLDGMTSLVAYQDVGDPALYPLQRPAPPSATDAGAPEHTRMRIFSPQKTAAPVRGHAGGMQ